LAKDAGGGMEDALSALALAERERQEAKLDANAAEELRALILIHRGNVHRQLALAAARGRSSRARVDAERGEAMRSARQAMEIASAMGLERLLAAATANLGELEIESGDLTAARHTVNSALGLAVAHRAFETEWRARWYLARIALAEKDSAAAERHLEEAARIVEAHRSLILDADHKAGYMASKVGLYEDMARQALDRGDGRAAFAAAERCRARSFMESLGLRFLLLGADRDRTTYREYLNLLSRTEDRARGGGRLFGIPAAGSYEDLRSRLDALRKKIRESPSVSPLVHALVEGEPASVEAVQRDLLPSERLVEYFGAEDAVAAFVIGPRSFTAVRLSAGRRDVERRARDFADRRADDPDLASALGRDLLEPILPSLAEGSEEIEGLTIVPFGELHRLPFEALRVGGAYLIERFAVAYLPTASVLKYLEKGGREEARPRRLLAVADPDTDYDGDGRPEMPSLNGALSEVQEIAPLFPESKVLSRGEASKAACTVLAPGREIIHFACHGEFFPARPLDSRLYLSKSGSTDGLLRASEIYGIDLRGSRLVALSGCETARSSVSAGEDPVGIGMAFLHTGAGALLASLWKVEDRATALLMKTFYRKWLESGGAGRARALREAKLALLHEGKTSAQHWASFILIGPR
jgi:CHAT domain-containing protein